MTDRQWIGKAVHLSKSQAERSGVPVILEVSEYTARKLALALAKLKQTTMMVPPEVDEILTALNYVLVGDPASAAEHRKMNASKGMEPSGSNAPNGKWNGER